VIVLDGSSLSLDDLVAIAYDGDEVTLAPAAGAPRAAPRVGGARPRLRSA
jgi:hypothetical protein